MFVEVTEEKLVGGWGWGGGRLFAPPSSTGLRSENGESYEIMGFNSVKSKI